MSEAIDPAIRELAEAQPPFADMMGMRLVSAARDQVVAEMVVTERHGNRNNVLHGGAVMAFADNLGGTTAFLNLPPRAGTTTIESKTNFLRAIPIGDVARAVCRPVHVGRTTIVLQTEVFRQDGKLAAVVTQTQLVMKSG